jgi:hypothetical protein
MLIYFQRMFSVAAWMTEIELALIDEPITRALRLYSPPIPS